MSRLVRVPENDLCRTTFSLSQNNHVSFINCTTAGIQWKGFFRGERGWQNRRRVNSRDVVVRTDTPISVLLLGNLKSDISFKVTQSPKGTETVEDESRVL
jgi:hypothetical protein